LFKPNGNHCGNRIALGSYMLISTISIELNETRSHRIDHNRTKKRKDVFRSGARLFSFPYYFLIHIGRNDQQAGVVDPTDPSLHI